MDIKYKGNKKYFKGLAYKARIWMNENNEEFLTVCDFADLDPQFVIRKKNEIVNSL